MSQILIFSHMMKTAGTSLNKMFIEHFGNQMHIVPGGLELGESIYDYNTLTKDIGIFNNRLRMISGHPLRPYMNFGDLEDNLLWFTFLRNPYERYVSHYLHDLNWTVGFEKKENKTIQSWENIYHNSNYQVKFIAGEESLDKAIELIENKFKWVGITEEFDSLLPDLIHSLNLKRFHIQNEPANRSLSVKEEFEQIMNMEKDFILENNYLDFQLYEHVKKMNIENSKNGLIKDSIFWKKNIVERNVNMFLFQMKRQMSYRTSELNLDNIKRYYKRWYR